MNLRIPGPTPLPDNVIAAMGQQMINHRGPQFEAMHADIVGWLKTFFETENDIYLLTSSGTGGMETGIVNTLSPGDRVLSVAGGVFGERYAKIAEIYGADVTRLTHKMGTAAKPEEVASIIREQGPFKAVTLTQNETSTGVLNDIGALAAAIHEAQDPSPLILVDGISGLGAVRLQMDAWGIDFVATGSQKAWMSPPGIAMVAMSPRAWEAYETAKCPRFYFDLGLAKRYALKNQTPTTPSVQTVFALHAALADMVDGRARGHCQATRRDIGALPCPCPGNRVGTLCRSETLLSDRDGRHVGRGDGDR